MLVRSGVHAYEPSGWQGGAASGAGGAIGPGLPQEGGGGGGGGGAGGVSA